MAIRNPDAFTFAMGADVGHASLPDWNGLCNFCGHDITVSETYWYWALSGAVVYMHVQCLVAWFEKLRDELNNLELMLEKGQLW
jgi:hypothetical protein